MNKIFFGDCVQSLRALPEKIVHTCVTSPPYFGLRDYQTGKWEGGEPDCAHMEYDGMDSINTSSTLGYSPGGKERGEKRAIGENNTTAERTKRQFRTICGKCGSRRVDAQIGLEQTPDEYVAKLVEVFREVRRVLRDDGTLWLNLGDSYAGSWGSQGRDYSGVGVSALSSRQVMASQRKMSGTGSTSKSGLKPKDLIGIPWRVAFALQADGWFLRQDLIWAKPKPHAGIRHRSLHEIARVHIPAQ
jgi:DNA modification methylase